MLSILSLPSFAYARGGICRSDFCKFTATIVGSIVLIAFILSVAKETKEKGIFKGITEQNRKVKFSEHIFPQLPQAKTLANLGQDKSSLKIQLMREA